MVQDAASAVLDSASAVRIVRLDRETAEAHLDGLVELLRDSVAGGASVGYVAVPDKVEAEAFWHGVLAAMPSGAAELFVALRGGQAVGTVQLQPSPKANQRHRGDIAKLLVHSGTRRLGIGKALMETAEARAAERGLTLLTLDTCEGGVAERLYAERGWVRVGAIPDFAVHTDGQLGATVIYYKSLGTGE